MLFDCFKCFLALAQVTRNVRADRSIDGHVVGMQYAFAFV